MKQILILLIALAALTFFTTCNKNNDKIIIEGKISDAVQGIPLEDVSVMLYGKKFEGGVFNPNVVLIAETKSNSDGVFRIDINQVKASDFELSTFSSKYFDYKEVLTDSKIASGKAYKPTILLDPISVLSLHVKNTKPIGNDDVITYRIESDNPTCQSCCNDKWVKGEGKNYNVQSYCNTKANKVLKIRWNVHKGTVHRYDSVSIKMPLFDTAHYQLAY